MCDRDEFEYWADEFDHSSVYWKDMGRDEIFMAGMQAARAQQAGSGEAVGVDRGMTVKESWWSGYRAGKGLPADTPRQIAIAATPQTADNKKKLQALRDSINGDCYMGEEWELKTIDELLSPPAEGAE